MEQGGVINVKQVYRDDYHMYEIEETRTSMKTTLTLLSKQEQGHIRKLWQQWEKASTAEIAKFTKEQLPYTESLVGQVIAYDLITKEERHAIF
jgi:hypothetical protein